jgi:CBS domain containing-hemolysin-like protein
VLRRLSFHLSGAQLGITVTSLLVGFVAEPLLAGGLEDLVGGVGTGLALALSLAVATIVQMVVGELVPKNVAIARPVASAFVMAPIFRVYGLVFGPMITFLNEAANWTVRRFGIEPKEELASVRTIEELELLIRSSGEHGTLPASSTRLLTRSIRFTGKTAADALVPRTAVSALGAEDTAADLVRAATESGYSRFPVVGADLDDVAGLVHVKDVYRVPYADRATTPLAELMHDVLAVPESRSLESLLVEMRGTGAHLAVVIDEYGGTAGIITLEDVLEEIVGEIDDEHDPRPAEVQVTAQRGTWELPGSLHLDEVADACGLELPEGEYETAAGFVLDRLQHIPEPGESFEIDGWRVEVADMDRLRVASIRVTAPERAPA